MNNRDYVGITISDIHVGSIQANELYRQLNEKFIKYLKELNTLDFIVICGDLFDSKLSLNSDHVKMAFIFFRKLIDICIEKNTKLRIIKGTEFHDNKQLDTLNHFSNSDCDIKIINTVTEEELFKDFKVLYIPEEYITDKDEYYKDYFNKSDGYYDMIFGHGLVNEVAFTAKLQESEVTMNKAPIFKSDDLLRISKGPIFFGHIHKSQIIKDRFYYCGSFTRWIFGEEHPKGFFKVIYSKDDYTVEFIENDMAKIYTTLVIDYNSSFFKSSETHQIDYIIKLVNGIRADRVRVIFNIPEDYPNPLLLSNLITEVFNKYKYVSIVINNNSKELQKKKEMESKIKILLSTYDFIFDKSISIEEKLCKFIKTKYNKDINVDDMRNFLYQKMDML